MSAVENTPLNRNYLSPLNYKFSVKKLPHVNFFLQKVNIPSINIQPTSSPNPFVAIPYSGDHIQFGTLSLSFKVDEKLENYKEIMNWMYGLGFPNDFKQYSDLQKKNKTADGIVSDVSIIVTDSSKNPRYEFIFVDAFPTYLSDINLDTTSNDVDYVTVSSTFKYTYFTINNNL